MEIQKQQRYRIELVEGGTVLYTEAVDASDPLEVGTYFNEFAKQHSTEGDSILYDGNHEIQRFKQTQTRGKKQ